MEVELLAMAWMLLGGSGGGTGSGDAERTRTCIFNYSSALFNTEGDVSVCCGVLMYPTSDIGLFCPSFPNCNSSVHLLTDGPNLHLVLTVRD